MGRVLIISAMHNMCGMRVRVCSTNFVVACLCMYVQRPDRYKVRNEVSSLARKYCSGETKKKKNAQHIHTPTEQTDFSFSAPSSSGNCVNSILYLAVTHTYFAQSKACQPDHHCGRLGVLCWVYCTCVSYVVM